MWNSTKDDNIGHVPNTTGFTNVLLKRFSLFFSNFLEPTSTFYITVHRVFGMCQLDRGNLTDLKPRRTFRKFPEEISSGDYRGPVGKSTRRNSGTRRFHVLVVAVAD